MNEWSPAEERDFQRLVRQAEQQSQEYYRRAGGVPLEIEHKPTSPAPQHPNSGVTPPPQHPNSSVTPPQHYRVRRKRMPLLDIDSETAVLVALLWLLWQEQADMKAILAIAYILIV